MPALSLEEMLRSSLEGVNRDRERLADGHRPAGDGGSPVPLLQGEPPQERTPLVRRIPSYAEAAPGAAYISPAFAATLAPHELPCRIVRRGFAT